MEIITGAIKDPFHACARLSRSGKPSQGAILKKKPDRWPLPFALLIREKNGGAAQGGIGFVARSQNGGPQATSSSFPRSKKSPSAAPSAFQLPACFVPISQASRALFPPIVSGFLNHAIRPKCFPISITLLFDRCDSVILSSLARKENRCPAPYAFDCLNHISFDINILHSWRLYVSA